MGIVFRQSIKTTIVTFTGALIGALTLYFGAKYIPKQELGFFRNSLPEQALLMGQVLLLGLQITLIVFIHKYPVDDRRRHALISINLIVPLLVFACLLPLYFLGKPYVVALFQEQDVPLISRFYIWLPVLVLAFIYLTVLEQYLISQLKVAKATFMREVLLRLLTVGLILAFAIGWIGFDTLVPASVLIYGIPVLLLLYFSLRTGGFRITLNWKVFDRGERKELVSFTWYHFLHMISVNLMAKLDIILLSMWSGLSAAAVYGIAAYILSFLQIPYRGMLNAAFPILTQAYHSKDQAKVRDVFVRSSLNILVASVGLAAVICCNLDNAVAILPAGYEPITTIVLVLAVGRLFDLSTGMNDQILSVTNYYRFSFYVSMMIVGVLLISSYLLIPRYSFYGAAAATTVSLILYNVAKLVFLQQKLRLQPYSFNSLKILGGGTLAALAGYLLPFMFNPVVDAIVTSIIILVIYTAVLWVVRASEDLNRVIAGIRKDKRLF